MLDIDDNGFSTEESVSQKQELRSLLATPSSSKTAKFLKQELEIQLFNAQMEWIIMRSLICKRSYGWSMILNGLK